MLKYVCAYCDTAFAPTSNRPQIRCSDCRRRSIKPTSPPCVDCGQRIAESRAAAPRCHPCRRKRNDEMLTLQLVPRSKMPTTARGYGGEHQKARAAYVAAFKSGDPCVRCGDPMLDVSKTHLDHSDDRSSYLGLAHGTCNMRAGAAKRDYSKTPKRLPDRVCDGCGLSFHPKQRTQWHCSRACVSARRKVA